MLHRQRFCLITTGDLHKFLKLSDLNKSILISAIALNIASKQNQKEQCLRLL